MTLQQLEYIIALDDHRHFVKAAEHCFITQPTLTMQVKKLEDEINLQLFIRQIPLIPTKLGEDFILRARQIMLEVKQLKAMVSQEKESIEGTINIGVIPTIAPYLLPLLLPYFTKKYPKTFLQIREMQTHEIVTQLKSDRLDMGILATPLLDISIREIPVYYEPFLLYLFEGHELLQKTEIESTDFDTSELLLLSEGHCFREQALEVCNSTRKFNKGFHYESGSIETIKQLVRMKSGITLIPQLAILNAQENLHCRHYRLPEPTREISIVTHKSYTREVLINSIHQAILDVLPYDLQQNELKIKVKWK